jgi:2-polyprenyl-6-methoxyphenol hydroxylase-like FAD-dependent oxidoreductase
MEEVAFVFGASVAGLCTAAAIAPFFKHVYILERDPDALHRKGIPQRDHLHLLLPGGLQAIQTLFPSFMDEIHKRESRTIDFAQDFHYSLHGYWMPQHSNKIMTILQHRHVLDEALLACIRTYANISIEWGSRRVAADVAGQGWIIDATGRYSTFSREYIERADETQVHLRYATMALNVDTDIAGLGIFPSNDNTIGVGASSFSDGHVLMTTFGYRDHRPPCKMTLKEFSRHVSKTNNDKVIHLMEHATSSMPHTTDYNLTGIYNRRYRLPAKYLVVGDALCALDPVFGQGMTKAALQALAIRESFQQNGTCVIDDYAWMNTIPYTLNVFETRRYDKERSLLTRFVHRVMDNVVYAASRDAVVYDSLLRALFMMTHPVEMVRVVPRIVWLNL